MIDPQHEEAVVLSYRRALSTLLRLISGLATSGALVYLLGWFRSSGYYGSFKAEWMLPNVPFAEFASRGILPIFALAFGLVISFSEIANKRIGIKHTKDLLVHAIWCFFAIAAIILLGELGYDAHRTSFAVAAVFAFALFAMTRFGGIVLELGKNDFKWRREQILALFWIMLFFVGLAFLLGSMEGDRDKGEATSMLPIVAWDDRSTDIWRLLAVQGELSYLVKLSPDLPSIKITKSENVRTIAPYIKTLNKKQQQELPSGKELRINERPTPEGLSRFFYISPLANPSCCYSWAEVSPLCPSSFSRPQ